MFFYLGNRKGTRYHSTFGDKKYWENLTKDLKERIYSKSIPDRSFLESFTRMVAEDRHIPGLVVSYPYGTVIQQEKPRNKWKKAINKLALKGSKDI